MLRTSAFRLLAAAGLFTLTFGGSVEPGKGTEQGHEKKAGPKKYPRIKLTPRLNRIDPTPQILDALMMLEDAAEELHSDGRGLCEYMRNHVDPAVRIQAARTYAKIGTNGANLDNAAESLADQLKIESNDDVKAEIIFAMSGFAPRTHKRLPLFLDLMKDKNPKIRRAAFWNITKFLSYRKDLFPVVVAALDDPDPAHEDLNPKRSYSVSETAMSCLQEHRTEGKDAVPRLVEIYKSKKGPERYYMQALGTLASVAPDHPLPLAMAREQLKKATSELEVCRALGLLVATGAHAKAALPELIAVAEIETDLANKSMLVRVFRAIGPEAKEAIPILEGYLTGPDGGLRLAAREAIDVIQGKK